MADTDAEKIVKIGKLLSENGCDCDCDHASYSEEHDADCDWCLACRISEVLMGHE